jgi:hypothetical protein
MSSDEYFTADEGENETETLEEGDEKGDENETETLEGNLKEVGFTVYFSEDGTRWYLPIIMLSSKKWSPGRT